MKLIFRLICAGFIVVLLFGSSITQPNGYITIEANGTPAAQAQVVNFVNGTNTTVTATTAIGVTTVTYNATGGGGGCTPAGSSTDILTDNGAGGCNSNANALLSTGGILTKYAGLATAGLGVPAIVAQSVLSNSSATSVVILATAPAAGDYEIHYNIDNHTPCTTGTAQFGLTLAWTANNARIVSAGDVSMPASMTTTSGYLSGVQPIHVVSGNVTYTPVLDTACTTGTATWDGDIWLTRAN